MYSESVEIINPTGLHARPAAQFVQAAKQYSCKIKITNCDRPSLGQANAKSIVSLLALELVRGTLISISAEGEDAESAVKSLVSLVKSGLGEM